MDSKSVLVLEDDEATAAFLADNLTADGFRVATAGGAGEGWRAIELRHPELLVLDLGLADGSGLELLDRLRSADRIASRVDPGLPVIVVSGRASEVDRVRGLARGADDYLAKPSRIGCLQAFCVAAASSRSAPSSSGSRSNCSEPSAFMPSITDGLRSSSR